MSESNVADILKLIPKNLRFGYPELVEGIIKEIDHIWIESGRKSAGKESLTK
jgi:hypothetical protein